MPFENNSSIFELNLTNYSKNFFPNTLGIATINSLKLNKSSTVKVGFLSSGYNKYGFDLQFSNTEFKTKYSQENINPLSINFRLIRPNAFRLFQNWDSVFKASFGLYLIMKFNVMRGMALLLAANQTFVIFQVEIFIHLYKMELKSPQFL